MLIVRSDIFHVPFPSGVTSFPPLSITSYLNTSAVDMLLATESVISILTPPV